MLFSKRRNMIFLVLLHKELFFLKLGPIAAYFAL